MELRDIEIFLTLAEELHFGRTAARLYVSQARISQAISQQERRIGTPLFDRSNRRQVRLTPVGQQLRDDLQPVYQGLHASLERARLTAQGESGVLRVGMIPSNAHDLRPFWQAFRTRHPEWGLHIRHNPFINPFEPLRAGDIDALVAWLPVEEPDLSISPVLFTEPRVVLVTPNHDLADHQSVSLEVLGDYGVIGSAQPLPEYWENAFIPFYTPSNRPIERRSQPGASLDDIFTNVGTGGAIHILGSHVTRYHSRPDITYLPVHDGPPLRWALIWRTDTETDAIRALVEIVRDLGTTTI
ncbi:LysR family transcriptional regulator [Kribbella catacumbae]|uniref:LysR family transcriptional regulator n=1 Tax=Kribbella catacumbae TaxID=460086 RepID=UPI00036DCFE5|nr:LysR family transcriptional regulator [Kribbella catacumbae]